MDRHILDRLLNAEEEFLSAVTFGAEALQRFNKQWMQLLLDCEEHLEHLQSSTKSMVHIISSRISILADGFIGVEEEAASLLPQLLTGFEEVLGCADASSLMLPSNPQISKLSPACSPSSWLLQNLHNPYPSLALKASMEQVTSKPVSEWFTKTRQRIGWTRLLRERFSGRRSAATDAAFRAYVRDDPKNPLDPQLLGEFMAIKANAELILSQTEDSGWNATDSSRGVSPVPFLTHSPRTQDSEDGVPRAGLKRSISQSSVDLPTPRINVERPSKRHRTSTSSPPSIPIITSEPCQGEGTIPAPANGSRKRHLSTSDSDGNVLKRPRGLESGHVVSDPFPNAAHDHLDQWFENFILPSPATTNAIYQDSLDFDPSDPLFIEDSYTDPFNFKNVPPSIPTDLNLLSFPTTDNIEESFAWEDFVNLDAESDSSSTTVKTPSDSPHPDVSILSPEVSLEFPEMPHLPPVAQTTKSVKSFFDLNPMFQAFSEFFSPSSTSEGADGTFLDGLSSYTPYIDTTPSWLPF